MGVEGTSAGAPGVQLALEQMRAIVAGNDLL